MTKLYLVGRVVHGCCEFPKKEGWFTIVFIRKQKFIDNIGVSCYLGMVMNLLLVKFRRAFRCFPWILQTIENFAALRTAENLILSLRLECK